MNVEGNGRRFQGRGPGKGPRITLVNAWSDANKGDLGISEGTVCVLREAVPKAQVTVVSLLDKLPRENHRYLLQFAPHVTVIPALYRKNILFPILFLRDWLMGSLARNPALRVLRQSDLVIGLGGHHFVTHGFLNFRNYLYFIFVLCPFVLAARFGKPFFLLGHSVGPFETLFSAATFKWVALKARFIGLRESLSYNYLKEELGVPASKMRVLPDLAFFLSPRKSRRVSSFLSRNGLAHKKYWAVTVRKWGDRSRQEAFLGEMAGLIRSCLEKGLTGKVLLMVQSHGPIRSEDDREVTADLYRRLRGLPVILCREDFRPEEYMEVYRGAGLLIGTRFHSVIFAVNAGTPVFAVSYFGPKAPGIMKMLGLARYCVDMRDFNGSEAFRRIAAMDLRKAARDIAAKSGKFKKELLGQVSARIMKTAGN